MYIKRFKTGKVSHYLRPVQIKTGKWAIETKNFKETDFIININYPLFNTLDEANKYLEAHGMENAIC